MKMITIYLFSLKFLILSFFANGMVILIEPINNVGIIFGFIMLGFTAYFWQWHGQLCTQEATEN